METAQKSSVLLIGSGGVGTIAAFSLEYGCKALVTAVVRSDYEFVKANGYKIRSCDYGVIESFRPTNIVNNINDAVKFGPFAFIIVTTKNLPDIFKVEDMISPVVTPESSIVLIQNGIDIGTPIINTYPNNVVLSGVSMISSTNNGGIIDHEGTDSLRVGYFLNENLSTKKQKVSCERFIEMYKNEHNECLYDEDVHYTRWRKLVYNATLNPICTLTGVDVGRLELFGGVERIVRKAMREVLKIAESDGVCLPHSVIDSMIRTDDGIYYAPSMLVDLRKGNYIELEVICGNALKLAEKNGISAPTLGLIYDLLSIVQQRTKELKGLVTVPAIRPAHK